MVSTRSQSRKQSTKILKTVSKYRPRARQAAKTSSRGRKMYQNGEDQVKSARRQLVVETSDEESDFCSDDVMSFSSLSSSDEELEDTSSSSSSASSVQEEEEDDDAVQEITYPISVDVLVDDRSVVLPLFRHRFNGIRRFNMAAHATVNTHHTGPGVFRLEQFMCSVDGDIEPSPTRHVSQDEYGVIRITRIVPPPPPPVAPAAAPPAPRTSFAEGTPHRTKHNDTHCNTCELYFNHEHFSAENLAKPADVRVCHRHANTNGNNVHMMNSHEEASRVCGDCGQLLPMYMFHASESGKYKCRVAYCMDCRPDTFNAEHDGEWIGDDESRSEEEEEDSEEEDEL